MGIKVNERKSTRITFTLDKDTWPQVTLNENRLSLADGLYLDIKLTQN